MPKRKPDSQLVELAGRNWLASELMRAGIEVARPERDRGIDLIAYLDRDKRAGRFIARPIQMKAASHARFSLYPKYGKFRGLLLAYVWNLGAENPSAIRCFALTYKEALGILRQMGYARTHTWRKGGASGQRRYVVNKPSRELVALLSKYEMNSRDKWYERLAVE
jgi:hypothetical protein